MKKAIAKAAYWAAMAALFLLTPGGWVLIIGGLLFGIVFLMMAGLDWLAKTAGLGD